MAPTALVTTSRLSITQSLPVRLQEQIRTVSGVKDVTYAMWFGGIYQGPEEFLPQLLGRAQLLRRVLQPAAAAGAAQGLP